MIRKGRSLHKWVSKGFLLLPLPSCFLLNGGRSHCRFIIKSLILKHGLPRKEISNIAKVQTIGNIEIHWWEMKECEGRVEASKWVLKDLCHLPLSSNFTLKGDRSHCSVQNFHVHNPLSCYFFPHTLESELKPYKIFLFFSLWCWCCWFWPCSCLESCCIVQSPCFGIWPDGDVWGFSWYDLMFPIIAWSMSFAVAWIFHLLDWVLHIPLYCLASWMFVLILSFQVLYLWWSWCTHGAFLYSL